MNPFTGGGGPPVFFRSTKGDAPVKAQTNPEQQQQQPSAAPVQSRPAPVQSAPSGGFEQRGRTMNPPEERKIVNRNPNDEEETSLTREKNAARSMKVYEVGDGEFTNFPEINATSAQQLIARGIKSLFPIQSNSFYPVYNREDVIARDLTGSGKTLAFCLPVTEYLRKNRLLGTRRIQAIILGPTRELAIQVSVLLNYLSSC